MRLSRVLSALLSHILPSFATPVAQSEHARTPDGTVIFRGADGRTLTIEDLQRTVEGTFQYEIISGENISQKAQLLHEQGREAGARGEYGKAVSLFQQAANLAPQWPYPVYDLAFTHLLMRDDDGALGYYQKTIAMSPRGFFTAITAADTLERERDRELPTGTYTAYVSLESLEGNQRTAAARELVKHVPQFAPGWKEYASVLEDPTERLAAIEKGLAAQPDAETKGMLQINKALALNILGNHEAAVKILGELVLDPNSTFGTEHSAKAAMAILSKQQN